MAGRSSAAWRRTVLLLGLAALVLLAPSAGRAITVVHEIQDAPLAAVDTRTATVAPTAVQTAAVKRLDAAVRWNELGTPQSLIRYGGVLAEGIRAESAVDAARSWLAENKGLFRLSTLASLELASDVELRGSDGHAVVFRQRLGGLATATDGVLVVGVVGTARRGWDVGYVSSRITGDTTVAGTAELTPVEAWVEAADRVGEDVSTGDVRVAGKKNGWTLLDVQGFEQRQSVRAAAFARPRGGPVRTYETTVLRRSPTGTWRATGRCSTPPPAPSSFARASSTTRSTTRAGSSSPRIRR
jgi:extracellular elastinolytic metalloproteinase